MKLRICMCCGVVFSCDYADVRRIPGTDETEYRCPVCGWISHSMPLTKDDLSLEDDDGE